MKDIIFHIGMPRTATTFLQQQIFSNIDNIMLYPKLPPKNKIQKYNKVLISNEMLCMMPRRYRILNYIKNEYPNAKIIMCIRKYNEVLNNLYNHLVTYGLPDTKKQWKQTQPNTMKDYTNYVKQTFPTHLIYQYTDFLKDQHKTIKQICKFINEPIPKYTNKIINSVTKNKQEIEHMRTTNTIIRSKYNPHGIIPKQIIKNTIINNEKEIILEIKHPHYNTLTFTKE